MCSLQVKYTNPKELWQSVSGQEDGSWYAPAVEYWDQQPASYDGVLAGVSPPDLEQGSLHVCYWALTGDVTHAHRKIETVIVESALTCR